MNLKSNKKIIIVGSIVIVVLIVLIFSLVSNNNSKPKTESNPQKEEYNFASLEKKIISNLKEQDNFSYLSVEELVTKNYLEDDIVKELENKVCDGYALNDGSNPEVYLKCSDYMTEGYYSNKPKEDTPEEEPTNELIKIPNVTNYSVSEAKAKLESAGFIVASKNINQPSESIPSGKVISTNPPADSLRETNTEVTLIVSTGSSKITIENYLGKNYLEVKGQLEALGLKVLIEKREDNSNTSSNSVIGQSLKAGEKVEPGSTITLYIPDTIAYYPDFTNGKYTISDIESFANSYNLDFKVEYVTTNEYAPGTIYYQPRSEGYRIVAGQSFTIKIAQASS